MEEILKKLKKFLNRIEQQDGLDYHEIVEVIEILNLEVAILESENPLEFGIDIAINQGDFLKDEIETFINDVE